MAAGPNYPQLCMHVLMAILSSTQISEARQSEMLGDLRRMYEPLGTCQRILRYPIPLSYTRHTSRFMLTYLAFMPLALYGAARGEGGGGGGCDGSLPLPPVWGGG